jgi:hypothetical protein
MRSRVLAVLVVLAALPISAARAAPTWVEPVAELTPLQTTAPSQATVLTDRDGNVLVAWQANNADLMISERLASGAFSQASAALTGISGGVSLGLDGDGVVHAFMVRDPGSGNPEVEELLHRIGSATPWTGATILAQAGNVFGMRGIVNPAGDAFVVLNDGIQPKWAERASGGAWTAPANLSTGTPDYPTTYNLAMDVAGDVVIGYERPPQMLSPQAPFAIYKPAGSPPSTGEQLDADLSDGASPYGLGPVVAIDDSGTATAVFSHGPDPPTVPGATVQFSTRARADAHWTKAQSPGSDLSSTVNGPPANLAVTVLANGETFAFWAQSQSLRSRRRAPGATTWDPEVVIPSDRENNGDERVVAAPDGTVTVVFDGINGGNQQEIRAAQRLPGGAFTALPPVPAPVRSVIRAAAADQQGNVVIAWVFIAPTSPPYQVRATALDVAGPTIDTATFPGSGAIGEAVPFSAHATDLWSPAIGYAWDFGDGTSSTDAAGTKAFAAGGTFAPGLTATDGYGNATTRGFSTTIPAAAAVKPVLGGLSIVPSAFRAAAKGGSIAKAIGATVRYADSAAATATLTVHRPARGIRKGKRCVKRPRHARRGAKRCTRYVKEGSFTHADSGGTVSLRFTGRVRNRKLRVGRHRLSIVARNAAGASKAVRKRFRIIRR